MILILLPAHVTVQYGTFPVLVGVPLVAATNVWYFVRVLVTGDVRGEVLLLLSGDKCPGVFRVDYP